MTLRRLDSHARKGRRRLCTSGDAASPQIAVHASLPCNQAAAASIFNDLRHQLTVDALAAIGVAVNQCTIAILIDEARDSAAALIGEHDGALRKQAQTRARHAQTVVNVVAGLVGRQRADVVVGADALCQLQKLRRSDERAQIRLTDQDHL